jgi:hypothetical protein
MLVHESRILQVTLFSTLKDNMNALDFSLLLPDVMTIADEVDAQLTQTMSSYMKLSNRPKAPKPRKPFFQPPPERAEFTIRARRNLLCRPSGLLCEVPMTDPILGAGNLLTQN